MGICIVATVLRLDFESVGVTEMGSSRAQYLRSGRLDATRSACTLLTRDTEQQLSNGKGSRSPADVTEVHRLLRRHNWVSGFAECAGMVTAGNPNNGVDVDGWSNEDGGDGRVAEVEFWFSDPAGIEVEDFSVHWASYFSRRVDNTTSCCLSEFTSSDGTVLRDVLDGRFSECLIALQPHLLQRWQLCCRPYEHLLPSSS